MILKDRGLHFVRKHPKKLLLFSLLLIAYYCCLPKQLFKVPTATVVESRQGTLVGAKIADDGQWRFPVVDSVPKSSRPVCFSLKMGISTNTSGFNPVFNGKGYQVKFRCRKNCSRW